MQLIVPCQNFVRIIRSLLNFSAKRQTDAVLVELITYHRDAKDACFRL